MYKAPIFSSVTVPVLALAVSVAPLVAQQDVIEWRDGKVTKNAKVTAYTAREIKFRAGGTNQVRAAHEVKSVQIEAWRDLLSRAGDDPEALIGEAQDQKNPFLAQAAYYRAAELYRETGATGDMITVLDALLKANPNSAYAPEYFRRKIQVYLSAAKPRTKDAAIAAEKYGAACRQNAWSKGYELDAELWQLRAKSLEKGASKGSFVTGLKGLIARSNGAADGVAADASADLADSYRAQKNYKDARATYEKLQETVGVGVDTLARIYLGLGYIHLEEALASSDEATSKVSYHKAFRSFLKVYVNAKDANNNLVAEGLYNAANACEKWNGLATCRQMAGRLRGRLKFRVLYKDTYWAKKK
ncbi:MAG: tetratricopeptide repeat protein [Planctomycetota bacterium]|nr:tetratricopeptide repeat protein [Planctomycetota bacterium]